MSVPRRKKNKNILTGTLKAVGQDQPVHSIYINKNLSWLEFNKRVLEQAYDEAVPLLDRVRFLGIFQSNLDEFFMKRVGILRRNLFSQSSHVSKDGLTASQQFFSVRQNVLKLLEQAGICFKKSIKPHLSESGIHLLTLSELTKDEKEQANEIFKRRIFPVLTPLSVDPGHPFPYISNLSYSLAVSLKHPGKEEKFFARVKIPEIFSSWIEISKSETSNSSRWISTQELVIKNIGDLFPDMEILATMPFRVTRNIEVERNEESAEDLLQMIEEELRERKFEDVVKIEHGPNPDEWLLSFLTNELGVTEHDLYKMDQQIDFTGLKPIWSLNRSDLLYPPWIPLVPHDLFEEGSDIFHLISQRDVLVHHPFESFSSSVERLISVAIEDPKVLAIKMTLYRTPDESTIAQALIKAAEAGKQVACVIELKARFDEQRNIAWANRMEDAGVHVGYGMVGLKVHCKTLLIVRQEGGTLKTYAHIGTGNYHSVTARIYTDVGLFTSDKGICDDLLEVFNYLTGRSLKKDYHRLLVAPVNMKKKFLDMINHEIENKKAGKEAHIIIKVNNLEDHDLVTALYEASRFGVKIDLIVRSICTLKPNLKDTSENIRVISVVDQFLEHSRIFYFRNGAQTPTAGNFFFGSADWMYRNLLARVEVIAPIEDPNLKARCWEILNIYLNNQFQTWEMQSDGSYKRLHKDPGESAQRSLMKLMREQALRPKE
ncbi:MAG: polyphosphate kinase 1 [Pseudomonadota bacterium]|nr:polyphosphate kinase 1 [Pseudomonadota bacterium]